MNFSLIYHWIKGKAKKDKIDCSAIVISEKVLKKEFHQG
jgi:hypothetical protein